MNESILVWEFSQVVEIISHHMKNIYNSNLIIIGRPIENI